MSLILVRPCKDKESGSQPDQQACSMATSRPHSGDVDGRPSKARKVFRDPEVWQLYSMHAMKPCPEATLWQLYA
eukprot:5082846-Amphidinium_carterae.2